MNDHDDPLTLLIIIGAAMLAVGGGLGALWLKGRTLLLRIGLFTDTDPLIPLADGIGLNIRGAAVLAGLAAIAVGLCVSLVARRGRLRSERQ